MRRIAIMNYKGGTGKTCTAVNLAHGLSLRGKKVLLIDTDPQGSVSHHLGIKPLKTLYDVLMTTTPVEACIIGARNNLDVICSNERVYPADLQLATAKDREIRLAKRLRSLRGYDFVIIDSSPSMNLINQNVLTTSTEIMVPVNMEYLSLMGIKQLLQNIKIVNRIFNKGISIQKIIPTFYESHKKKSNDVMSSLKRVFPNVMTSPVRYSVSLSEAPGFRKTIFEYDPQSKAAADYDRIIQEVLENG